jgi:hypothetical protein
VPSLDDFSECDLIVIGHSLKERTKLDAWLESGKQVLDLVGKQTASDNPSYSGLYW